MKKLLLAVAIYFIAGSVFADGNICQMVPGGILDQFQADFYNQAQQFSVKVLPTVTNVYWFLFALWAAWELAFDRILGMKLDTLLIWWFTRLAIAYTIQHIFLDPTFYIGIIKFGASLGSKMGGFVITPTSTSPLGNFTPSAIMGINDCVAVALKKASVDVSPFNVLASLQLLLIQIGFLVVTSAAAGYILYISIKVWMALFAGFVNAMFAGNSWTVNWWQQYLSTVIKYALELMMVAAMFGIINNQLMAFVNQLTAANAEITGHFGTYLKTMAEVGFMVYLLFTLPKEMASSMGGSFGGKLTDLTGKIAGKAGKIASVFGGGGKGGDNSGVLRDENPNPSGGKAKDIFISDTKTAGGSKPNPDDWGSSKGENTPTKPIPKEQWKESTEKLKS